MSTLFLVFAGCETGKNTVQEQVVRKQEVQEQAVQEQDLEAGEEREHRVELAPGYRSDLLEKAKEYMENRDYTNALINIIRAEKAAGEEELGFEIGRVKNNLIENLNARAIYDKKSVGIGKGLDVPLKYMVFFMEGEVIYPAFNVPVFFEVKKGKASITGTAFTNTSGIAECEVARVESVDGGEVVISAGVYLDIEGETYHIAKLLREFTLHYRSIRDNTIAFVVFEKNIDEIAANSSAGTLIEGYFVENGFSVLQGLNEENEGLFMSAVKGDEGSLQEYKNRLESSLLAFTHIAASFSSKVSEGFFFAKANIMLSIFDATTERVVFSTLVEEVKGAGNTELKAGRKAIIEATGVFINKLDVEIATFE
jgi:hypothetical protein